jgi:hypothetical protein
MAVKETNILKLCQIEAAKLGACLFRNNRGMFLTLDGKRKVRAGLEAYGSSDLIGWTKEGKFLAVEVKTKSGSISKEQENFIEIVNKNGGIAFVARNPDDISINLSIEK